MDTLEKPYEDRAADQELASWLNEWVIFAMVPAYIGVGYLLHWAWPKSWGKARPQSWWWAGLTLAGFLRLVPQIPSPLNRRL